MKPLIAITAGPESHPRRNLQDISERRKWHQICLYQLNKYVRDIPILLVNNFIDPININKYNNLDLICVKGKPDLNDGVTLDTVTIPYAYENGFDPLIVLHSDLIVLGRNWLDQALRHYTTDIDCIYFDKKQLFLTNVPNYTSDFHFELLSGATVWRTEYVFKHKMTSCPRSRTISIDQYKALKAIIEAPVPEKVKIQWEIPATIFGWDTYTKAWDEAKRMFLIDQEKYNKYKDRLSEVGLNEERLFPIKQDFYHPRQSHVYHPTHRAILNRLKQYHLHDLHLQIIKELEATGWDK